MFTEYIFPQDGTKTINIYGLRVPKIIFQSITYQAFMCLNEESFKKL